MTRINSNIPPSELTRVHLVAELREITMVPASLKRSLRTKTPKDVLTGIPKKFTLNGGHVKFFHNKLGFLQKRFHALADEMVRRGYNPDRSRVIAFAGFGEEWMNDWQSTKVDDDIVRDRIALRISEKPHLYKD
jgi:deoxyribonuclease (pyrimidine dimer)